MFIQDLRLAVRQLQKNPGFVLAVTLTLALGIGVNTAVFTLVNAFLLRPLPYPEPNRLAVLVVLHQEGISSKSGQFVQDDDTSQDGETWEMVRDNVPAVQAAAFGATSGVNLQAGSTSGTSVRYVQDMRVSAHYFDVLGIQPFLGRGFTEQEDRPNGPNAVILSYALWQSVFHGDPQVLGSEIRLKGEPYTRGWDPVPARATHRHCGRLHPAAASPEWRMRRKQLRDHHAPGAGRDLAASLRATGSVCASLRLTRSRRSKGRAWFYASPLDRNLDNGMRKPVIGLMLAVSFILLIACANLAGLTLVRIAAPRRRKSPPGLLWEQRRWVVLRQLWVENLVLAFMGAAIGLALARGILSSLPGFLPDDMMPLGGLAIDVRVLAFTFAASLFTSLLFGALPALQIRRVDLRSSMATAAAPLPEDPAVSASR